MDASECARQCLTVSASVLEANRDTISLLNPVFDVSAPIAASGISIADSSIALPGANLILRRRDIFVGGKSVITLLVQLLKAVGEAAQKKVKSAITKVLGMQTAVSHEVTSKKGRCVNKSHSPVGCHVIALLHKVGQTSLNPWLMGTSACPCMR